MSAFNKWHQAALYEASFAQFIFSGNSVGAPCQRFKASQNHVVLSICLFFRSCRASRCRIGRFQKAICPEAKTFAEALPEMAERLRDNKDKKILLYCTGGIRCEKASSYFKHQGFKDVSQLYGGIINYAHEVRAGGLRQYFVGKNYVFDGRTAEPVTDDIIAQCDSCGAPCSDYIDCANPPCNKRVIQCRACEALLKGYCAKTCMESAKVR